MFVRLKLTGTVLFNSLRYAFVAVTVDLNGLSCLYINGLLVTSVDTSSIKSFQSAVSFGCLNGYAQVSAGFSVDEV